MDPVTLLQCSRCLLTFVQGTEIAPGCCPACRRFGTALTDLTVIRNVRVGAIREYGMPIKVRKGIEFSDLGYCEHGFITAAICPECK